MNNLLGFVDENFQVLIPVLYIIGMFLKATPKVKDWTIPYILMIVSILLAFWITGVNVNSLIQGILVAGGTVLANQLIKQGIKRS